MNIFVEHTYSVNDVDVLSPSDSVATRKDLFGSCIDVRKDALTGVWSH